VKHAGAQALAALEPLLEELRKTAGLVERKRGIFYRGAAAFVHFHEDSGGLFADLRNGDDWERYAVNTRSESARLLRAARLSATARPHSKSIRRPRSE
jgi:hypothetical protein